MSTACPCCHFWDKSDTDTVVCTSCCNGTCVTTQLVFSLQTPAFFISQTTHSWVPTHSCSSDNFLRFLDHLLHKEFSHSYTGNGINLDRSCIHGSPTQAGPEPFIALKCRQATLYLIHSEKDFLRTPVLVIVSWITYLTKISPSSPASVSFSAASKTFTAK